MQKITEVITLKNGQTKKVTVKLDDRTATLLKKYGSPELIKAYVTEEYYARNMEDCARHHNLSLEMLAEQGQDVEDLRGNPLDGVLRDEEYEPLYAALQRLPERQREAITLYFLDGMTLKEVGEEMGISETRAWQLCELAKEKLKVFLKNS